MTQNGGSGQTGENHPSPLAGGVRCQYGRSEFRRGVWFKEEYKKIAALKVGVSTCRSIRQKGELIERTYDYVITGKSVEGKIHNLKVVEDSGSRPHTTVTFQVEKDSCAS